MKTLILGCLLAISGIVSSQNYRTITGAKQFFVSSNEVRAISVDSFIVAGNGDTVYYNYNTIVEDSSHCARKNNFTALEVSGEAWSGDRIIICQNGLNIILNRNNDSIFINTLATVGSSWKIFDLPGGNTLQATIDSITYMVINGTLDSVKYISLKKHAGGSVVSSPMNNVVLQLSKNHGWVTIVNFKDFGSSDTTNSLVDFQIPSGKEVYDFGVGDEFQYRTLFSTVYYYDLRTILAKDTISFPGYVSYIMANHYTGYSHNDTVKYPYTNQPIFVAVPEEGIKNWDIFYYHIFVDSLYGGDYYIDAYHDCTARDSTSGCYYPTGQDCGYPTWRYIKGLGAFDCHESNPGGQSSTELFFWKRNGIEHGARYTSMVDIGTNQLQVSLSPNLADDKVDFHFNTTNGSSTTIQVTDITGRRLLNQEIAASNSISINTTPLSNGLYLYHIKCGSNYSTGKLVIAR